MGGIALDAHTAAAAIALLAPPEFMVEKGLVDGNSRRKTADKGYEGFAVAFAGCRKTKHELSIITVAAEVNSSRDAIDLRSSHHRPGKVT
jgi:hypothetical protein